GKKDDHKKKDTKKKVVPTKKPETLPVTGPSTSLVAAAGAMFVLIGAFLLAAFRRRHQEGGRSRRTTATNPSAQLGINDVGPGPPGPTCIRPRTGHTDRHVAAPSCRRFHTAGCASLADSGRIANYADPHGCVGCHTVAAYPCSLPPRSQLRTLQPSKCPTACSSATSGRSRSAARS